MAVEEGMEGVRFRPFALSRPSSEIQESKRCCSEAVSTGSSFGGTVDCTPNRLAFVSNISCTGHPPSFMSLRHSSGPLPAHDLESSGKGWLIFISSVRGPEGSEEAAEEDFVSPEMKCPRPRRASEESDISRPKATGGAIGTMVGGGCLSIHRLSFAKKGNTEVNFD